MIYDKIKGRKGNKHLGFFEVFCFEIVVKYT